ncbi:MAG: YihA family ribosome biogenesis GTP-binding protein [Deltaproteobacteria bacterium]|nr:MAG: YihA family ribosome biogenesis GTP-binding protein [Deltaproteobacteria bacterium]
MIIRSASFVKSAVKPSQYPPSIYPEIGFVGRSNVGKSSLINTLVNRRSLVKTSNTPGRTQLINFFDINAAFYLVDLPGYGYAKVPRSVKRAWQPMVQAYLDGRETLTGIVFLMDIRREPREAEFDLLNWFAARQLPTLKVLTKADKFSKARQQDRQKKIAGILGCEPQSLIRFSAKSRQGKEALWQAIAPLVNSLPEAEGVCDDDA